MRYWEDVQVGEVFVAGPHEVTEEAIIRFASKYDPQYFHLDAEAAKTGPFGVLSASGWHTGSIAMRLMVKGMLSQVHSQGAPGVKLCRWLKPVSPGMQLSLHTEVLELYPSKSRREIGFCSVRHLLRNVDGTDVLRMENVLMIGRDPARTEAA
ncbi:MAG: MaoC family dehydratase [Pseudomonadota bacterium]|nr:MaoC family dehydratase [Pseudomonadota bacterium]